MASTVPAPHQGNPPDVSLRVVCAWCKAEIQAGADDARHITHGICPACAARARRGSSPIAVRLFFTGTVGSPAEDVRVEAFRREDGTVGIQHVYTRLGDTWLFMSELDQASLLDQAKTAFALDAADGSAVDEGRHGVRP